MKPKSLFVFLIAALLMGLIRSDRTVQASTIPTGHVSDTWRSGVQVNGAPAPYSATSGRARSAAAVFRSAAGDSYFVVAAPARPTVIRYTQINLLGRTGSYSGSATLSLEILNLDGSLASVLSTSALDLQAVSTSVWQSLNIAGYLSSPMIQPGQFLAYHFHLDGPAGGDLNVPLIFEAAASDHPYSNLLLLISR